MLLYASYIVLAVKCALYQVFKYGGYVLASAYYHVSYTLRLVINYRKYYGVVVLYYLLLMIVSPLT